MQSNKNSLSILVSPAFLVGLGLLLLNDFFLKAAFHNWFTGKLSDFAGLFIFPLFFTAFVPKRKRWIYAVTAIGFVFWKSGVSQPLIDLWNTQPYFNIGRVVDYTDLIMLLVMPLSFLYGKRRRRHHAKSLLIYASCLVSIFAFAATSFPRQLITYYEDYKFDFSQSQLIDRIKQITEEHIPEEKLPDSEKKEFLFKLRNSLPMMYDIQLTGEYFLPARIMVTADEKGSKITLISTATEGPTKPGRKAKQVFKLYFEKQFIEVLRVEPVQKSPIIKMARFRRESPI